MRKIICMIFMVFVFCSCGNYVAGLDSDSKKEIMESWVWKMFIFTDLGEFSPVETVKKEFDNTAKANSIFTAEFLEIYRKDKIFISSEKENSKEYNFYFN